MPLSPDTVLQSRYRIIRKLGEGGMGSVYLAVDGRFDSEVAIKETHFTDETLRKQFEREARLLNKLRHPAVTRVIDHFTEGAGQFLVMDYVEGHDLADMLEKRGGAFAVSEVLPWADQLLDALSYLHRQNPPIIHRDIKQQNLKLSPSGQIILLDFGLAKGFAGQLSRVTTSGSIFGYTPNYAPLEQVQGTGTDPRSDLYSLAATLYRLLTGVIPPDALSRASASVGELPDPLRPANELNTQVSPEVAAVLKQAMAQHPSRRFATAEDMRRALHDAGKTVPTNESRLPVKTLPAADTLPAQFAANETPREIRPTITSPGPAPPQRAAIAIDSSTAEVDTVDARPRVKDKQARPVRKSLRLSLIVGALAALIIAAAAVFILGNRTDSASQSPLKENALPANTAAPDSADVKNSDSDISGAASATRTASSREKTATKSAGDAPLPGPSPASTNKTPRVTTPSTSATPVRKDKAVVPKPERPETNASANPCAGRSYPVCEPGERLTCNAATGAWQCRRSR